MFGHEPHRRTGTGISFAIDAEIGTLLPSVSANSSPHAFADSMPLVGIRTGGLRTSPRSGAASAAPGQAARSHDNVLRPWRERVAELTEQLGRMGADGAEQRAVWGQQIAGLREQFTQARTLLEVRRQHVQAVEPTLVATEIARYLRLPADCPWVIVEYASWPSTPPMCEARMRRVASPGA